MLTVLHSMHPQYIKEHILWVYVVDGCIYCEYMLWTIIYIVSVCCGEHSEKRQVFSTTYHLLWRTVIYIADSVREHVIHNIGKCYPQHTFT